MNLPKFSDNELQSTLTQLMFEGKLFSAYDVTLLLRKKGFQAFHKDVRDSVHSFMSIVDSNPVYLRTTHEVNPENGALAEVYHPSTVDVKTYKSTAFVETISIKNKTTSATTSIISPIVRDILLVSPSPSGQKVDARGSYTVRKSALGMAFKNLKSGDKVWYQYTKFGRDLVLSNKKFQTTPNDLSYTVDKSGNIRITRGVLLAAGFSETVFEVK